MSAIEKKIDAFRIGVAVHTYGHVDPKAYANHVGVYAMWARHYNIKFLHIDGVKTAEARNMLVEQAIAENCTHLFFLDSDHLIEESILPYLLGNTVATVVSGLVVRRNGDDTQVGFVMSDDGFYNVSLPTDGVSYAVDACAFGCTLIDLSVFKSIEKPYFKDVLIRNKDNELIQRRSDVEFCREVRSLGKNVRIDTRVRVGHIGMAPIHYPKETEYQVHTYEIAAGLIKSLTDATVIDFGCGSGRKLIGQIEPISKKVIGLDLWMLINGCKSMYPDSTIEWVKADLSAPFFVDTCDVAICADVIEHMDEPGALFNNIKSAMSNDSLAVISTPDVSTFPDAIKVNPAHKQSWDEGSFKSLLAANGFDIVHVYRHKEISDYISMVFIVKKRR